MWRFVAIKAKCDIRAVRTCFKCIKAFSRDWSVSLYLYNDFITFDWRDHTAVCLIAHVIVFAFHGKNRQVSKLLLMRHSGNDTCHRHWSAYIPCRRGRNLRWNATDIPSHWTRTERLISVLNHGRKRILGMCSTKQDWNGTLINLLPKGD